MCLTGEHEKAYLKWSWGTIECPGGMTWTQPPYGEVFSCPELIWAWTCYFGMFKGSVGSVTVKSSVQCPCLSSFWYSLSRNSWRGKIKMTFYATPRLFKMLLQQWQAHCSAVVTLCISDFRRIGELCKNNGYLPNDPVWKIGVGGRYLSKCYKLSGVFSIWKCSQDNNFAILKKSYLYRARFAKLLKLT